MPSPSLKLNDGRSLPQLGFGTWRISDRDAEAAVADAIAAGYRLIDTASIYENEAGVGRGLRASAVPRDQIFLTTKVWNDRQGYDATLQAAAESLRRLGTDYLDLYLIHWPVADRGAYPDSWRALIELRKRGLVRSIGVSNFHAPHLRRIIDETGITPAVNQIELHPLLPQTELRRLHAELGIVTESWSPLAQGALFKNPRLAAIARKYSRPASQIILRWHLDHGLAAIPKSSSPTRARENLGALDFRLDPQDLATLDALDENRRIGPDPERFE